MLALHGRLGVALGLYFTALGLWGIVLGLLGSGPSPSFRGGVVIAEVVVVLQGTLGVLLYVSKGTEWIHALYGLALLAAMPLAASVARDYPPRRMSFALGLAALFSAGLVVRGISTA